MSSGAPRPALGLSVAVTGHRADRITDAPAVSARFDALLADLRAVLQAAGPRGGYASGGDGGLRLLSALAEGADRIGADAAVAAGVPLDVVVPFPIADYEEDFAEPGSRDGFRRLVGAARSILILDGPSDRRALGYEAAGLALLDNCDLLVAVWDGAPGRGRGGTYEVLAEAIRRALPIVLIPPDGRSADVYRPPAETATVRPEDLASLPAGTIEAVLSAQLTPPPDFLDDEAWRVRTQPPQRPLIYPAYSWLLRLAGVGRKRARRANRIEDHGLAEPPPQTDCLAEAFAWWDARAVEAAQAFRSAVIVTFALAALAVVLAAASVLAGAAKWLFVLAEIATILALSGNVLQARKRGWQERWLDAREVAELIRVTGLLRAAGIGRGEHARAGAGDWKGWYAGALARALPLPGIDLSHPSAAAGALLQEIEGQAAWNDATAHRMHVAAHRIERFGEVLFGLVLVAAIGWLALRVAAPASAGELAYLLTALTAGLPAIATASYGIRVILDFEGVSQRAHRIASRLHHVAARLREGPADMAALQACARRTADIMLADVAAWRLLAEGRRLSIPG